MEGQRPGQVPATLIHPVVHLRGPMVAAEQVKDQVQLRVAALLYPFIYLYCILRPAWFLPGQAAFRQAESRKLWLLPALLRLCNALGYMVFRLLPYPLLA